MHNITRNSSFGASNCNFSIKYTALHDDNTMTTSAAVDSLDMDRSNQIFYIFLGIFGFVSNIYVIIIIATYKPMRKNVANAYMANQSILDATASVFLLLTTIYQDNGSGGLSSNSMSNKLLCGLWYTKMPLWGMLDSSTYNIVALTFERYIAIVHPIWHKTKLSQNKLILGLSLAFSWFIGLTYNAAYMLPTAGITDSGVCKIYSEYSSESAQMAQGVFGFCFEFFIPATLIILGYTMIGLSLHRRVILNVMHEINDIKEGTAGVLGGSAGLNLEDMIAQNGSRENASAQPVQGSSSVQQVKEKGTMTRARRNVLITSAIISMFFIFSWSWNECYYLAYNLSSSCCTSLSSEFNIISSGLVSVNCCANPIIYSLTYTEFKRGATRLFARIRKKSTTVSDSIVATSLQRS